MQINQVIPCQSIIIISVMEQPCQSIIIISVMGQILLFFVKISMCISVLTPTGFTLKK